MQWKYRLQPVDSLTCPYNVPPDSASLVKTSVMPKCMNGWQNCHSRICVGAMATANGTRNVAYYMTTGQVPISATRKKKITNQIPTLHLSLSHRHRHRKRWRWQWQWQWRCWSFQFKKAHYVRINNKKIFN